MLLAVIVVCLLSGCNARTRQNRRRNIDNSDQMVRHYFDKNLQETFSDNGKQDHSDYDKLIVIMTGGNVVLRHEEVAGAYSRAIKTKIKQTSCYKSCGSYDDRFKSEVRSIAQILSQLSDVENIRLKNTFDNLLAVLRDIRPQFTSPHFFDSVVSHTIGKRNNSSHLFPSSREVQEKRYFNSLDAKGINKVKHLYKRSSEKKLPPINTVYESGAEGTEQLLDYFREDNGIHTTHDEWHHQSEYKQPSYRHGERFIYHHRQILNRYLIERRILGLPDVIPLELSEIATGFRNKYTWNYAPKQISNNQDNCSLNETQVNQISGYIQGLSVTYDYREFLYELEKKYHDKTHNIISHMCRTDHQKGGYFDNSLYSARDPVFYRLHSEIERFIKAFQNRPYTWQSLLPADGLFVEDLEVLSRCAAPNNVETFYRPATDQLGLKQVLDHEEFDLNIRILNKRRAKKKVVLRMFIALPDFHETGNYHVEADRWVHTMTGKYKETITRNSMENALTNRRNASAQCGWPHNLLLPRGRSGEKTPIRIVVFVHDPLPDGRVSEGNDMTKPPYMMCGFPETEKDTFMDERKMGFPLDEDWLDLDKREVIENLNPFFGKVSTIIQLKFSEDRKETCED